MKTMILCTRSTRLGDFDWLARSLKEQTPGEVVIERCVRPADLTTRLEAIAATDAPLHVHLLAEARHGQLMVAPGEALELSAPIGRASAPHALIEAWIWNDDGALPIELGAALEARFGIPTTIASISALKQRLRPRSSSSPGRASAPAPTRPRPMMAILAGVTTVVALWFSVHALVSALLAPWSLSLPDVFEPEIRDASRRWAPPSTSVSQGPGERVRFQWDFARHDWQAEWWILDAWLRDADAHLDRLAGRARHPHHWDEVYRALARDNEGQIEQVADAFRVFAQRHGLDRHATATLTLRFVQSIRYKIPGNRLGLLTPPRTLVERYGDCDTKSLLYVLLLRQLGIDAAIMLSEHYRHAMAGVALPAQGRHISSSGRRYYFTETTNLDFPIGQLPHGLGNLFRWRLVELDTPIRAFPGQG